MAEIILTILLQAIIGVIYSLLMYKAGTFGNDTGKSTAFNAVKMVLVAVVGGIVAGYLAYMGVGITPDSLGALMTTLTIGGFGIVALVDIVSTIIAGYISPNSKVAQTFTLHG